MATFSSIFGLKRERGPAYGSANVRKVLRALKRHGIEWPGSADDTYIKRQEDARGADAWHWYLILDTQWANENPGKVPEVGGRNPIGKWPARKLEPYRNDFGNGIYTYEVC